MQRFDAVIIGGGLAGAAAAIYLRRAGRSVLVCEKGTYPRHKLCGEFLSPEVVDSFERLGVREAIAGCGPKTLERVRITGLGGERFESDLPGTALGLTRYALDHLLVEHARRLGAEVREESAVRAVRGSLHEGFHVEVGNEEVSARMVIGAHGKRSRIDGRMQRPFLREAAPRVGFKAHFEGADLEDRIELHLFDGGYCGMSMVETGRANVCWIGSAVDLKDAGGSPEAWMEGQMARNEALAERFGALQRVDDWCAVAQVSFAVKGTFHGDVMMIGDAAAMIAPLCGDGMAMALRSAELGAHAAERFLSGEETPAGVRYLYDRRWRREFGVRLRAGRWLHEALCRPGFAHTAFRSAALVPGLARQLIRITRG